MVGRDAAQVLTVAPADLRRLHRRAALTLIACGFSLFMVSLDVTVINVALPEMRHAFQAGASSLQWMASGYVVALASFAVFGGSIGDRFGRRRVFQIGLTMFSLASLLCGLAPNVPTLVVFRVVQGVGASMLNPVTLSIITHTFTERREQARAIGLWAGVAGVSMAVGPMLGGVLVETFGWRSVFWINVPAGLLALIAAGLFVTESRAARPRRLDLPGQALITTALTLLAYLLVEGPQVGWTNSRILVVIAGAGFAWAAFVIVQTRANQPLVDIRMLRAKALGGAVLMAVLASAVFNGSLFLDVLYLQQVRGESPLGSSLILLPGTVAIALVSPIAGYADGRWGPRPPLCAAGLLSVGGSVMLLWSTPTTPVGSLVAAYVLLGLGWGAVNPPITTMAVNTRSADQAGSLAAMAGTGRQIGSLLGIAVLGSLAVTRLPDEDTEPLLSPTAGAAFTQATHASFTVGTTMALLVGAIALMSTSGRKQPHRDTSPSTERGE